MTKTTTQKERRWSKAKHKAVDDHPPSDRRMKRKLNDQPGVGQRENQATGDQSKEALFKIRHAAEFDDESVRDSGDLASVKHEQEDLDDTAMELVQSVSTVHAGSPDLAPLPLTMTPTQVANSARDDIHQEDIFVAILSQGSWDARMTQIAVDDLARRAQQNTTPGHIFNQTYVGGLIRLLDTKGVGVERRSQIISMLRTSLREPLAQWRLLIDREGSRSPPPTQHFDAGARSFETDSQGSGPGPSTSKLLYVDVRHQLPDETTTA